jgi:hypothetical protein
MSCCREHGNTMRTINEHLDSYHWFTYNELTDKILENGGILRTSICVTIRDYLETVMAVGALLRKPGSDSYIMNPLWLTYHHESKKFEEILNDSLKEFLKEKIGAKNEDQLREIFGEDLINEYPNILKIAS